MPVLCILVVASLHLCSLGRENSYDKEVGDLHCGYLAGSDDVDVEGHGSSRNVVHWVCGPERICFPGLQHHLGL